MLILFYVSWGSETSPVVNRLRVCSTIKPLFWDVVGEGDEGALHGGLAGIEVTERDAPVAEVTVLAVDVEVGSCVAKRDAQRAYVECQSNAQFKCRPLPFGSADMIIIDVKIVVPLDAYTLIRDVEQKAWFGIQSKSDVAYFYAWRFQDYRWTEIEVLRPVVVVRYLPVISCSPAVIVIVSPVSDAYSCADVTAEHVMI